MPLRTARKAGDTVSYRRASGDTFNVVVDGFATDLPTPTAPVGTPTTGGTLASSTTFGYKLTAVVGATETAASAEEQAATGVTDNAISLDWTATPVAGANLYRIYGRTATGPWGFLAEVVGTITTYLDDGSDTPGAAVHASTDHIGFQDPYSGDVFSVVNAAVGVKDTDVYFSRY